MSSPGPAPAIDTPIPSVPVRAKAGPLLQVARSRLAGGLEVAISERSFLPLVNLRLMVRGGSASVPSNKAGLAALTADMLDEGAGSRGAQEIARAFDLLGASYYAGTGHETSELELNVLSHRLPDALRVFADVVRSPTFPEEEFERVRDERRTRAFQELDDPRSLASQALAGVLFGHGHPWGRPVLGTRASLSGLTSEEVRSHYRQRFHPGGATLLVTGAFPNGSLLPLLEDTFGDWEERPSAPLGMVDPTPRTGCHIYLVDRPGSAQSEVRVGRMGVARTPDDYLPLTVMNTVLGGAFTSRLNQRLREEKGYTYGAGSWFSTRTRPGPFIAYAAVHTPVTADAVADILHELRRMREEHVTVDELERARRHLALGFPQSFETTADVTARLAELVLHELDDHYFEGYVERVMAVRAEDIQRVAPRVLSPEGMAVVVVGDRESVEAPLTRLGLGPPVILEAAALAGGEELP